MLLRHISSVLAAVIALTAHCAPIIKWDATRHDFGAFNEDLSTVTCTFKGINAGDEPLVIYDVRPNCGCTTTERYAGSQYQPGDSVFIKVTYNAIGRPGRFSKKVMIHSNADPAKQNLVISGTVIGTSNTLKSRYPVDAGDFRLHSSTVMMGEVYKDALGSSYFKGYNNSDKVITPVVVSKPRYMDVTFKPATVNPGEQFVVSVNHHTGECPQWGLVSDTIVIRSSDQSPEEIRLGSVITIREDFRKLTPDQRARSPHLKVTPDIVDLGRLGPNEKPVKKELTLANTGAKPLVLRRIMSPDPAVSVKVSKDKIAPGKSATMTVNVDPSLAADADMINARITIIANDPDSPTTIVRVVGELTH